MAIEQVLTSGANITRITVNAEGHITIQQMTIGRNNVVQEVVIPNPDITSFIKLFEIQREKIINLKNPKK